MRLKLVKHTVKRRYWSITFVDGKRTPIKLRMTNRDFKAFFFWLERNYPNWSAINVYHRDIKGGKGSFVVQLRKINYWNNIQIL